MKKTLLKTGGTHGQRLLVGRCLDGCPASSPRPCVEQLGLWSLGCLGCVAAKTLEDILGFIDIMEIYWTLRISMNIYEYL
jgi:hypothetical protein